ncbi:F-box/LRR-repeat protein 5 [Phyllopteryx taeniolatus]|uniref:F-box/LRR-repeat protein 5 n=1 Tax=Phyllopteryx taeniolatus TaxID=161469 RepID=UPI002AD3ED57|nr:F-box/LRR-repeat protein 5 [Phyllopteryx taeniolatus]
MLMIMLKLMHIFPSDSRHLCLVNMAPFPDEVDVFTGPHWRMKQLVGLYSEKLSETNFSNISDFRSFLQSLLATFKEFKMHEQIENEYIIGLLEQRCCTVYNMHSDNKLSDMLLLLEKGLHNVKSEYEQLNYAQQLKERLEAFTQDFLPHMKEEEEVFQPMLMQHFTYEELKAIKKQVMAQHCSQQPWDCAADVLKGFSLWSRAEELQKAFKYADHEKTDYEAERDGTCSVHIGQLPAEVVMRIFRYLGPPDLCRCSQVCDSWSELAKTGSLWRHLYPVRWARGDYYNGPPGDLDQEPDDGWLKSRENEVRAYQEWDEDADIDESDECGNTGDSLAISTARREKRLLNGIIQNLLPVVGPAVKSLVLAYGSTVSSKMVRQILSLCPNVAHLDLTQTDVTDYAFDSWFFMGACSSLDHLDLSGCDKLTDHALKRLSLGLGDLSPSWKSRRRGRRAVILQRGEAGRRGSAPLPADIEDSAEWTRRGCEEVEEERFVETQLVGSLCCCRRGRGTAPDASILHYAMSTDRFCAKAACCAGDNGDGRLRTNGRRSPTDTKRPDNRTNRSGARRALNFLSLSGCYQVTDVGLRAMSELGGLPALEHLNLSGCLSVTEAGLHLLVSACPALNDEHFYYCDNINGPNADTASGCQNLQCGFRACCRSGE